MSGAETLEPACAECNTPEPSWINLRLGISVCHGCCSAHRSLAREFSSYVHHISSSYISNSQMKLLQCLGNEVANSFWEEGLAAADINKPGPDAPTIEKYTYIQEKYTHRRFVHKSDISTAMNEHFFYCVISDDLPSTYRLLSTGVNVNMRWSEQRPITPLAVAAAGGQREMIELLVLHGANNSFDQSEQFQPSLIAQSHGFLDCARRIQMSELDILFRFFLCLFTSTKQDQHCSETAEGNRLALKLDLNQLSILCRDVSDEVIRREQDADWQRCLDDASALIPNDTIPVPFLPVTAEFDAVRLQSRQKLAKLSPGRLRALIKALLTRLLQVLNDDDVNVLETWLTETAEKVVVRTADASKNPSIADGLSVANEPAAAQPVSSAEIEALQQRCTQLEELITVQQHQIDELAEENYNLANAIQVLMPELPGMC
eukprot:TRINITY_DN7500_c0_g1_i4.p1 TRINITY_DN7500_c0_g1~~TRINITY_DN7500_c0_g1_i4.p1  ORF type:complete len:442 (+),score=70.24 TRINITY_DN7500_c0_g1_i4:33-1328(+)